NRKMVIYCETIDLCWRVVSYLWSLLPDGPEKRTRVRLYHAMCWPEENEETVRLIRDDPKCQVIVATIAFAQGFNVKPLLDCIQLGVPSSLNQLVQQEGRIGRDGLSLSRCIVLAQPKVLEAAERYMRGLYTISLCSFELTCDAVHFPLEMPALPDSTVTKPSKVKKPQKVPNMDPSKARLLVERKCLTSRRNILYQNPPPEQSALD
ncbi:hypothetical protein H0H93_002313, partial [Arthromyces matolae]